MYNASENQIFNTVICVIINNNNNENPTNAIKWVVNGAKFNNFRRKSVLARTRAFNLLDMPNGNRYILFVAAAYPIIQFTHTQKVNIK